MGAINALEHGLWKAALTSSLGPLSAYLSPQNYGLSRIGLAASSVTDDDFHAMIQGRIDLGRASTVAALIQGLGSEIPQIYRHAVHYSVDRIDGVLMVPRLVRERAAGRSDRIPVLRVARFSETPEALFVSELLRLSTRVATAWGRSSGAEGVYARDLEGRLRILESQQPWAALRAAPRASLRSLASSVKTRAVAGWTARGATFETLADLVLGDAQSVSADPGPIAFMLSEDERYADRIFELVCIGWLLLGLKKLDPKGRIDPHALKGSSKPLFSGSWKGVVIRLHYQAGYFSQSARYGWRRNGAGLRAIPDYSIELEGRGWRRSVLLDAKNRVLSGPSEVIYKLLGYQENLGISPYLAIGIAPSYGARCDLDGVRFGDRSAMIAKVPLSYGRRFFERMTTVVIDRIITSQNEIDAT
ncbi:hypothetical protein D3C72_386500 [compost metagenome]